MKSLVTIGLVLLLFFPACASDGSKLGRIRALDSQISNVMTSESAGSIQREELKKINRKLEDLVINETDPEVISLYHDVKTRLRDLYPGIE